MALTDIYVRDKQDGKIHKVGDNHHDSMWVSKDGVVHYQNLQNGDGCSGDGKNNNDDGYEFVPSDCGEVSIEGNENMCPDWWPPEALQWFRAAIAALEKQVAKKLDYEGDGCDAAGTIIFDTAICPTCKKIFEVGYDDNVNYCLECGQRLKWEE